MSNYVFDMKAPTVQMLGRWQPWHPGHRALFDIAVRKTGQVAILCRDCNNIANPLGFELVHSLIEEDLNPTYKGRFIIMSVPNIVNITYGREVGYVIEQEHLPPEIESISGTKIRKTLGL